MAEATAQNVTQFKQPVLPNLHFHIAGRVAKVEANQSGDGIRTTIDTPAPDLYSKPSSFLIFSKKRFASVGQEIPEVECVLSGYYTVEKWTDKDTRQPRQMDKHFVYLHLVE